MADPVGISVAFADDALEAAPTWTRIDDSGGVQVAAGFTIDRGRESELAKTEAGTATISITDTDGDFDPTNAGGPFYLNIAPGKQAAIALKNQVTDSWETIFRGHVEQLTVDVDVSEKVQFAQLELVDLMGFLAKTEMTVTSPETWGTTPLGSESGTDIYFPEDTDLDACQTRLTSVATSAGVPSGLYEFFTGNVGLQRTVYARHDQALSVCLDVADAEFPGVANFYASREGVLTFHGRYARFNPDDVQYHITTWKCGDAAAAAGDSNTVPISGMRYRIWDGDIINNVIALPMNVTEADVPTQSVSDATSITDYGWHSISFENLLTNNGEGPTTAVEETKLMAQYYVDNFAVPQPRVTSIDIRPVAATHPNAAKVWALLTTVEISDIITLYTTHPGGGGFAAVDYFVEGVHYQASPMRGDFLDITLTLDLSPRAFFGTNPWD